MQQIYVSNQFFPIWKVLLFISFATEFVLETIVHDQRQKIHASVFLFYDANFLMEAFFFNSPWKFPYAMKVFFSHFSISFLRFCWQLCWMQFLFFFSQNENDASKWKSSRENFYVRKTFLRHQKTTIFVRSEAVLFIV